MTTDQNVTKSPQWREGYDAYVRWTNGLRQNPYSSLDDRAEWSSGWIEARHEIMGRLRRERDALDGR